MLPKFVPKSTPTGRTAMIGKEAKPRSNVYLIGPMGSGKTSIGQRLARRLDLEFLDCDHELETQTGASVNLIFDVEGEEGFRERETRMLRTLTSRRGVLVATGGGAVLRSENREMLKSSGLVVYLRTSVTQQLRRVGRDKSRPLLQTPDRRERLRMLAEERNPLYEELADVVFPARNCSLQAAADALAEAIRERWQNDDDQRVGRQAEV
jgi:shikimate kinase